MQVSDGFEMGGVEHQDSGFHTRLFIPSQPRKFVSVVLGLPAWP